MTDPLLSTLCRVCNTNAPIYRCPRCSSETCSLVCSKRHKLRSGCNGIRDATAYRTRQEILTPAGIDHDYNFISAIERSVERSEKLMVEERGLVDEEDLPGRVQQPGRPGPGGSRTKHLGTPLLHALERSGVIVKWAPKGMGRNLDNTTYWNKHLKSINWQVEWIQEDGTRFLGQAWENKPIEDTYTFLLEEQRLRKMTPNERRQEKIKARLAKRARLDRPQDGPDGEDDKEGVASIADAAKTQDDPFPIHHFYLLKLNTPASNPPVLIPLQSSVPFGPQLRDRLILDFPTIYILSSPPEALPPTFTLDGPAKKNIEKRVVEESDLEEGELVDPLPCSCHQI